MSGLYFACASAHDNAGSNAALPARLLRVGMMTLMVMTDERRSRTGQEGLGEVLNMKKTTIRTVHQNTTCLCQKSTSPK